MVDCDPGGGRSGGCASDLRKGVKISEPWHRHTITVRDTKTGDEYEGVYAVFGKSHDRDFDLLVKVENKDLQPGWITVSVK